MRSAYKIVIILLIISFIYGYGKQTDANIVGHVESDGKHLPFVNVYLKGTTTGTITDETGHFYIVHIPIGDFTLVASYMGYKTAKIPITTESNTTIEKKINLEKDVLDLSSVVITANRHEKNHLETPVMVNLISPRVFEQVQTASISEALNFAPGLRIENNCQNCGFIQVRMNGLDGQYSQILINNNPIFSGLAGVYGLELIPANMIEQIEIIKGGGSAMFGGNAIAGTINLILKDPVANSYEAEVSIHQIGTLTNVPIAPDFSVNFNTSVVSTDRITGLSLYGLSRERSMYDANHDGFSEIAPIEHLSFGARVFHRFSFRNKLSLDFFNIREERNGGNRQKYPLHERDIAEALSHNLRTVALSFNQYLRESDNIRVFAAFQDLERNSYYGAERSLSDYGYTHDFIYHLGTSYHADFGELTIIAGTEFSSEHLRDYKLGYPNIDGYYFSGDSLVIPHVDNILITNQCANVLGVFNQYDVDFDKLKFSLGLRYDHYSITDHQDDINNRSKNVFSPRISILYKISETLTSRINYAYGYRAPQIFSEDLHIETSGARRVIHQNAPDLKQESSNSVMASINYANFTSNYGFLLTGEAFYTRLNDPFVNVIGEPDEEGTVIYTRTNATSGASVKGVNIDLSLQTSWDLSLESGFTLQSSLYDLKHEFNERKFFRTPSSYGYFSADWLMTERINFIATGTYTGKMLVPYFGYETDSVEGELRISQAFFDAGLKIQYQYHLNGAVLKLFAGIKNIFNSFQSDFDIGIDRDPGYIYGPVLPRTVYVGMRIGNRI